MATDLKKLKHLIFVQSNQDIKTAATAHLMYKAGMEYLALNEPEKALAYLNESCLVLKGQGTEIAGNLQHLAKTGIEIAAANQKLGRWSIAIQRNEEVRKYAIELAQGGVRARGFAAYLLFRIALSDPDLFGVHQEILAKALDLLEDLPSDLIKEYDILRANGYVHMAKSLLSRRGFSMAKKFLVDARDIVSRHEVKSHRIIWLETEIHAGLATAMEYQGNPKMAGLEYELAISNLLSIPPRSASEMSALFSQICLGYSKWNQDRKLMRKAEEICLNAIKVHQEFNLNGTEADRYIVPIYIHLSKLYRNQEKYLPMRTCLDRAAISSKVDPHPFKHDHRAEILISLGYALFKLGEEQAAVSSIFEAIGLGIDSGESRQLAADILEIAQSIYDGNPSIVIDLLGFVINIYNGGVHARPGVSENYFTAITLLAEKHLETGNTEKALNCYRSALGIEGRRFSRFYYRSESMTTFHIRIAQILYRLDEKSASIQSLANGLKLLLEKKEESNGIYTYFDQLQAFCAEFSIDYNTTLSQIYEILYDNLDVEVLTDV